MGNEVFFPRILHWVLRMMTCALARQLTFHTHLTQLRCCVRSVEIPLPSGLFEVNLRGRISFIIPGQSGNNANANAFVTDVCVCVCMCVNHEPAVDDNRARSGSR